jgi:hypothetical protein
MVSMANFNVTDMYFGVATELDQQFYAQPNDGIVGTSFRSICKEGRWLTPV